VNLETIGEVLAQAMPKSREGYQIHG